MHNRALGLLIVLGVGSLGAQTSPAAFSEVGAAALGSANHESRSASLADIDNDGDLDLFFQGGGGSQQLYRNNKVGLGTLTFTNVSTSLPSGLGPSWSAAWGDYDSDGQVDVFVGQSNIGASGDVLKNDGRFGFTNPSVAVGLNDPGFHQNVAWSDIDLDNDLDLVIAMEGPEEHQIYRQSAAGTFQAIGASVGLQVEVGIKAYGMAIGDSDGDGDMDIYISTCRADNNIRNNFFKNMLVETGSLSFVDIADSNGTQFMRNSYGTEFHDFDNDGDLDLFMVGADQERSKIFRNNGGNQFTDVDTITGRPLLTNTGGDLNGGRAVDYDNDGDLDLFFHDHLAAGSSNVARKLYRNDGGWTFTDVTAAQGLNEANRGSYDSPWGDLDLDGDMDLVATTDSGSAERIYLNDASANGNHWLQVRLEGPQGNTTGIGAALYATTGEGTPQERTLRREANTNAGTFNQSDLPVHFGLGAAGLIDQLLIHWPDGSRQYLMNVAVDQYLTVSYAPTPVGDFNADGLVDAADYTVWRDHLGQSVSLPGDPTPGTVDASDYTVWKSNFGASASLAASIGQVPEPAGLVLSAALLVLSAALLGRRQ